MIRACKGGTGNAKTGGNYAGGLNAAIKTKEKGFDQTMWLSAEDKDSIEELSGMNFFCVIDDKLYTPELTDTILNGITRKSIIELARHENIEVVEKRLSIKELKGLIKEARCTEAFACGTAAIITPIDSFHDERGESFHLKSAHGPVARKLRNKLLGIQQLTETDSFGWIEKIKETI